MAKANKKPNKKKQQNQQGFTLIELLAVITIMGILMMVAIPSVSRTIENSRRDSFANVAKSYIESVRNGLTADNISCCTTAPASGSDIKTTDCTNLTVSSALPDGTYYYPIATAANSNYKFFDSTYVNSTKDLMESGGKSPYGSAEMYGYIEIVKATTAATGKTTTKFKIALIDSGKHGFAGKIEEQAIKRSAVSASGQELTTVANALKEKKFCKMN